MGTSPGSRAGGLLISGRYRIVRKLGSGSMGTVYLVNDESTSRLAALKLLRTDRMDPEGLEQLQREFRAIASLHHPQIATAHDFGYTEERLPFYTREYIEGSPLSPGPAGTWTGSPGDLLAPFFDLLEALHYLHAHEILHLDIHPGNLIVSREASRGSVLIDFGLLKPFQGPSTRAFLNSRSQLAPEILAEEPVGPATDMFAVGRLLLYRLTGSSDGEARLPAEIPGWSERRTLELERIVGKAIQRDPRQRFQSAAELRDALAAAMGDPSSSKPALEPGDLIIGRDAELEGIEEALRLGSEGRPAWIWFTGPEGIGKSRLLGEARLRAQLRGMAAIRFEFIDEAGTRSALLEGLETAMGARRARSSWIGVLGAQHGGSTLERARRAAESYFLEEGPPLVLLLDDLERCDRASKVLAEALISECDRREARGDPGRGLVILVATAGRPGASFAASGARARVKNLRPLCAADSRRLLATMLRPLDAPPQALSRLAHEAQGFPLRLRRLARGLHAEWKRAGTIPLDAEAPSLLQEMPSARSQMSRARNPADVEVLRALALLGRPARIEEIAAATARSPKEIAASLRRARREEMVTERSQGGVRRHHLASPDEAASLRGSVSPRHARLVHDRMIAHLSQLPQGDASTLESLARHLLAAGKRREGRELAMRAADSLRSQGELGGAISILSSAAAGEKDRTWRLRFAEEMSSLHEQAGDHEEGIVCLEPVLRGELELLEPRSAVRIRRRLGVHHHRAGSSERALDLFHAVLAMADPERDVEELIFVGSELAELHTLRGEYAEAEEACRRALDLLSRTEHSTMEFRSRMEVTLRASLGHLELRRMALDRARVEFEAAAKLARSFGTTAIQALILNNLGIVHNQQNDFARARTCLRRAERLLERTGERRGIISIACNLASIAAKTGDAAGAAECVERAGRILARYPARRLELQVVLTRAMVEHFLGDEAASMQTFRQAIPLARGLADTQFVGFAEVYLAEAAMACGHYEEAAKRLRRTSGESLRAGPPILFRMASARLFVVESLLGRTRAAEASRQALEDTARTDVALLEAWNDLFLALGHGLGERARPREPASRGTTRQNEILLEGALKSFRRLGIPAGARLARVGLLHCAIADGETQRIRAHLRQVESAGENSHRLLSLLEPLARAEASLALGELDRATEALESASCAIVGLPFLELDGRLELLRARLADRQGDREGARRHIQRSLHVRDLLSRSMPERAREGFLGHPRFSALLELGSRLDRPRLTPIAGRTAATTGGPRHGMVGSSAALRGVLETIDRLRDQEIPVLITGETGTGKELIARAIHETGPRRKGPFFALHCGSLPAELFESELFGHEAGAFTGADEPRQGLVEHLAGGTLLLDEVAGLSPEIQTKLLRLLDRKMIRPVGGLSERPVDVRFLAASSADVEAGIAAGAFRADLYFRLRGVQIHLEPLRARKEDIPLLARHFLALHSRRLERPTPLLTAQALALLEKHDWPGNVRELETLLVRALVTSSPGSSIHHESLRRLLPGRRESSIFSENAVAGRDLKQLKRELERVYLTRLFRDTAGDVTKMTRALGVKASRVYAWLKELGIDLAALRREL